MARVVEQDQIDEVERARALIAVTWDGPRAERRAAAHELAAHALDLAGSLDLKTIPSLLRVLGELIVEDQDADIVSEVDEVLLRVDAICVEAARRNDVSRTLVQEALWVRFWVAWDRGESTDLQFSLLDQIISLGSEGGSPRLAEDAQLRRGIELDRCGRAMEAFRDFDAVSAVMGQPQSTSRPERLAAVWYEKCLAHCEARRWEETLAAANSLAVCYARVDQPTLELRIQVAEARWMGCIALSERSAETAGEYNDPAAWSELDQLICWLRDQPEPHMQRLHVLRLVDRMRWLTRLHVLRLADRMPWLTNDSDALDVAEEVVALAIQLGDQGLIRYVAQSVAEQMPELTALAVHEEDQVRASVRVRLLEEGELLGDLDTADAGLSEFALACTARVSEILSNLGECLADDTDERASSVAALVLVTLCMVLGRLGDGTEQERTFDELASLGDAAVAACDEIAAGAAELSAGEAVIPTMVSMPMLKASLLYRMNRVADAIDVLSDVIETFGDVDDGLVLAMVDQARRSRRQLGGEP